ncbi:hypothetical protein BDV39DRAFT_170910 [Aspergillus sergii]|uniref:Uncharacterized protein n=1 Tax=Aspergillus sergii TaxID=1034303 RepID=A0A5N6XBB0_9EURO|nr:hypothetical protein BDV39DRAFT_170910 [Aspergillus sergii]
MQIQMTAMRPRQAKLFEITMLALSRSKLPVQMLDTFANSCSHLILSLCALVCGDIMAILKKANMSSSFRGCKNYLCVSHTAFGILMRNSDLHYHLIKPENTPDLFMIS